MRKIHEDRPLSLQDLGIKLRPVTSQSRTRVYLEPYGVRIAVHPKAKNVPQDGAFGPRDNFSFSGGIKVVDGVVHAMAQLCNQMVELIPMDRPLFAGPVQTDLHRQTQAEVDRTIARNRKRPGRMLPTRVIHFPR